MVSANGGLNMTEDGRRRTEDRERIKAPATFIRLRSGQMAGLNVEMFPARLFSNPVNTVTCTDAVGNFHANRIASFGFRDIYILYLY